MTVKKQYVELIKYLEDNKGESVADIMPYILTLCESKSGGSTLLKDDEGNVIAIFCYYHKMWEPISECEYGAKKNTSSGFNTMCKEGVSAWTKQQRIAKKAKGALLDQIMSGELQPEDLTVEQEAIEDARSVIVPREDNCGFANMEACNEYICN